MKKLFAITMMWAFFALIITNTVNAQTGHGYFIREYRGFYLDANGDVKNPQEFKGVIKTFLSEYKTGTINPIFNNLAEYPQDFMREDIANRFSVILTRKDGKLTPKDAISYVDLLIFKKVGSDYWETAITPGVYPATVSIVGKSQRPFRPFGRKTSIALLHNENVLDVFCGNICFFAGPATAREQNEPPGSTLNNLAGLNQGGTGGTTTTVVDTSKRGAVNVQNTTTVTLTLPQTSIPPADNREIAELTRAVLALASQKTVAAAPAENRDLYELRRSVDALTAQMQKPGPSVQNTNEQSNRFSESSMRSQQIDTRPTPGFVRTVEYSNAQPAPEKSERVRVKGMGLLTTLAIIDVGLDLANLYVGIKSLSKQNDLLAQWQQNMQTPVSGGLPPVGAGGSTWVNGNGQRNYNYTDLNPYQSGYTISNGGVQGVYNASQIGFGTPVTGYNTTPLNPPPTGYTISGGGVQSVYNVAPIGFGGQVISAPVIGGRVFNTSSLFQ